MKILEFEKQSGAPSVLISTEKPLYLCSPGWRYDAISKKTHRMSCKRRICDCCGKFWAFKWQQALREKVEYDKYFGQNARIRALGLTFAQFVDYKQVWNCLRYFFQLLRADFGPVQYWGVVEFNQAHTQPHLHFILSNSVYMKWYEIKSRWLKAQKWAGIPRKAWNIRIEEVKKDLARYMVKYLSKLKGGKNEVPTREEWQGRYIRYSKNFFPATIPTMALFARFSAAIEANDLLDYQFFYTRKPLAGLSGFIEQKDREFDKLQFALTRKWNFLEDKIRGKPVDKPGQLELSLPSGDLSMVGVPFQGICDSWDFWQEVRANRVDNSPKLY